MDKVIINVFRGEEFLYNLSLEQIKKCAILDSLHDNSYSIYLELYHLIILGSLQYSHQVKIYQNNTIEFYYKIVLEPF